MIFEAAYLGSVPIERIWLGGQIVWEAYRQYTVGQVLAALFFSGEPEQEPVDVVLMQASEHTALDADGTVQSAGAGVMSLKMESGVASDPENQMVERYELWNGLLFTGNGTPSSFGIVFTEGALAYCFGVSGIGGSAGTEPGSGTQKGFLRGGSAAAGEALLRLMEKTDGVYRGGVTGKQEDLWDLVLPMESGQQGGGIAELVRACKVRFLSDGRTVHQVSVLEGRACPDPVETGVIPVPTRESTPQYHYSYSGWEVQDSGDNGSYTELLPEQDIDFHFLDVFGVYVGSIPVLPLTVGERYSILWDGQAYPCTAFFVNFAGMDVIGLGNMAVVGAEDTGEPFLLGVMADNSGAAIYLPTGPGTHRVSVYQGEPAEQSSLEKIIGDTDFHATFTESIRYYTVRFWDGDTLVDTVTVPYGGTAKIDYSKEGYEAFWVPSGENITGDTDCYVTWVSSDLVPKQKIAFANASAYGLYQGILPVEETMATGGTYVVEWDGVEYTCKARNVKYTYSTGSSMVWYAMLGNAKLFQTLFGSMAVSTTEPNTGEPFLAYHINDGKIYFLTASTALEHTVRIFEKT